MDRSIFREKAFRRYSEARVEQVLPRLASPPVFRCLWAAAAILITGVALGAWTEIPVYTSAPAVVVPWNGSARVLAFFPRNAAGRIQFDRPLWIRDETSVHREKAVIVFAETEVISAHEAKRRYGTGAGIVADTAGPSVIVVADWTRASASIGKLCRAESQVGSRTLLSMLRVQGSNQGE